MDKLVLECLLLIFLIIAGALIVFLIGNTSLAVLWIVVEISAGIMFLRGTR